MTRKTSPARLRFIRSSLPYSRKDVPQKVHVARDAKDFEYSRGLCGIKSVEAWLKIVPDNIPALIESPYFCSGCRAILSETPYKARFGTFTIPPLR